MIWPDKVFEGPQTDHLPRNIDLKEYKLNGQYTFGLRIKVKHHMKYIHVWYTKRMVMIEIEIAQTIKTLISIPCCL